MEELRAQVATLTSGRDEVDSLRDENSRLRARVEELEAALAKQAMKKAVATKPSMRWAIVTEGPGGRWFAFTNVCNTLVVVLDAFDGSHGPWRVARAVWCAVAWAFWALAFVRRVPAEGARS